MTLSEDLRHALICLAFYIGPEEAGRAVEHFGGSIVWYNGHSLHEAIHYRMRAEDYVLFRGTDEIGDWRSNLGFDKIDFGLGKVHQGFYEAVMQATADHEPAYDSRSLTCLGHSKGAAMAAIYAWLTASKTQFRRVIMWGAPRAGDINFKNNMEKNVHTVRVIHPIDPVTWVPVLGYRHVGQTVIKRKSPVAWPFVRRHYMSNYVRSHPDFRLEEAPEVIRSLLR